MKKCYAIMTKELLDDVDRTDHVTKYLEDIGVRYSISSGVVVNDIKYVTFRASKGVWKIIKNDLNLKIDRVNCSFSRD